MIPDWCEIIVVKPTNEDSDVQRGACGRVFINGREIKSVCKLVASDIIGDEDIPSITLTIEPRSFRVMSDIDFEVDDEGVLVYDSPRKLRIRKQE